MNKTAKIALWITMALSVSVAAGTLSACSKSTPNTQDQTKTQEAGQDVSFQKYVTAYNQFLNQTGGLEVGLNNYTHTQASAQTAAQLATQAASKNADVPPITIVAFNYVALGVKALQEGVQSANAQTRPVDLAAKELLEKVKALHTKAQEFNAYYISKKYLDDNWAKDKAEKPALIALWKETIALNNKFGQEISAINDAKRIQDADALKAKGQTLQADTLLAISKAKEILNALKDKEKTTDFSATDSKVVELETILSEHEKAEQQAKADKKLDNDFYQKFRENLNQMVGQYRTLKAAPASSAKDKAFNGMVDAYNEAVFYKNQMH